MLWLYCLVSDQTGDSLSYLQVLRLNFIVLKRLNVSSKDGALINFLACYQTKILLLQPSSSFRNT